MPSNSIWKEKADASVPDCSVISVSERREGDIDDSILELVRSRILARRKRRSSSALFFFSASYASVHSASSAASISSRLLSCHQHRKTIVRIKQKMDVLRLRPIFPRPPSRKKTAKNSFQCRFNTRFHAGLLFFCLDITTSPIFNFANSLSHKIALVTHAEHKPLTADVVRHRARRIFGIV